jgi:hypothetical protein
MNYRCALSVSDAARRECEKIFEERVMSADQQVGLGFLVLGNGAIKSPAPVATATRPNKAEAKASLTASFAGSIAGRTIAEGDVFRHFLSMERKRAERSRSGFMLMVLRTDFKLRGQGERQVLAPIQRGIFSAIRNTDLVGWSDEDQAGLGILFTEIGEPSQVTASAVLKRVRQAISAHAPEELVQRMDVTCHVFQGNKNRYFYAAELCAAGD